MHSKKRWLRTSAIVLALVIATTCLAIALSDDAAHVQALFRAAKELAFATHNVSLSASAEFHYDGEWFKTFEGAYQQDDYNSYMNVSLTSPRRQGAPYVGGYTVYGTDNMAYAVETYYGSQYYNAIPTNFCNTVVGSTNVRMRQLAFAEVIAASVSAVTDAVSLETLADGTQRYHIGLASGQSSPLLDAALTYAADAYINPYDYYDAPAPAMADVYYEDWDALFEQYYRRITKRAVMPVNFIESARGGYNEEEYALYEEIEAVLNDEMAAIAAEYDSGVVYLRADGSREWFPSVEEYLIAAEQQYVYYDDYSRTFQNYYQRVTGEVLSDDAYSMIYLSENTKLWEAFVEMSEAMEAEYLAIVKSIPHAIKLMVYSDGSYEASEHINEWPGQTVREFVFAHFDAAAIDAVNIDVTLAADGTFTEAKGDMSFFITDNFGVVHPLAVTFTVTASDYGSTDVPDFDAEALGLLSYDEYQATVTEPVQESIVYPDTMTFNGVTYATMIYNRLYDYTYG